MPDHYDNLPLPRRIWWPWDQPAGNVGFERRFSAGGAAKAVLYASASGGYSA